LVALLGETVDDAWTLAQEANTELTIMAAPEAAPIVGDRALLARAIANVIHNAVKFSPPQSVVECAIAQRGHQWVISVRDEGPGIAPEQQRRLFEPFQRLHEHSHPSIDGIGLGLALVHTVVQRHGGALEVESEAGRGAEFRLVLPMPGM
jgi:signal transduction histidine kinase